MAITQTTVCAQLDATVKPLGADQHHQRHPLRAAARAPGTLQQRPDHRRTTPPARCDRPGADAGSLSLCNPKKPQPRHPASHRRTLHRGVTDPPGGWPCIGRWLEAFYAFFHRSTFLQQRRAIVPTTRQKPHGQTASDACPSQQRHRKKGPQLRAFLFAVERHAPPD